MIEYMETEYIKKPVLKIAVKSYFKHLINKGKYKIDVNDANADINRIISELPAADVAEVKHGYWKPTGRKLTCSVCGHRMYIGTDDVAILMEEAALSKYCFHCGAKMDGERKTE